MRARAIRGMAMERLVVILIGIVFLALFIMAMVSLMRDGGLMGGGSP
ncbi:hypothetical protein KY327_02535 [Candidatus Woesearchaeota archaeon]|nr:hypothetical protein [Candidatus Woesearchaeota archaeon]